MGVTDDPVLDILLVENNGAPSDNSHCVVWFLLAETVIDAFSKPID
jgi:hypothetical protein